MVDIEYIDTDKMNECGQELLEQIAIYKEQIDSLYDRINNMPTKTHEWIGNSSNRYVESFNNDYKKFIDINDILKQYAYCLIDSSHSISLTIKKVKRD